MIVREHDLMLMVTSDSLKEVPVSTPMYFKWSDLKSPTMILSHVRGDQY
jgi:hypothetical protein